MDIPLNGPGSYPAIKMVMTSRSPTTQEVYQGAENAVQRKSVESLVHDVEQKVVRLSPTADKDFLAIFLQNSGDNLDNVNGYFVLVDNYHCNVADCN